MPARLQDDHRSVLADAVIPPYPTYLGLGSLEPLKRRTAPRKLGQPGPFGHVPADNIKIGWDPAYGRKYFLTKLAELDRLVITGKLPGFQVVMYNDEPYHWSGKSAFALNSLFHRREEAALGPLPTSQAQSALSAEGHSFMECDYSTIEPVIPGVNDWWERLKQKENDQDV